MDYYDVVLSEIKRLRIMKKFYLGLIITGLLAGCSSTDDSNAQSTSSVAAMGVIGDGQFTQFRANNGKSDAWLKHADKNNGLGDVDSSAETASGDEGSVRIRFVNATDDFTAAPGISQVLTNVEPNTEYTLSVYYADKKGDASLSELEIGAKALGEHSLSGSTVVTKEIHIKDLSDSAHGDANDGFRQATVDFNSGSNTTLEIYALMHIINANQLDKNADISEQTEVYIDDFSLTVKDD